MINFCYGHISNLQPVYLYTTYALRVRQPVNETWQMSFLVATFGIIALYYVAMLGPADADIVMGYVWNRSFHYKGLG